MTASSLNTLHFCVIFFFFLQEKQNNILGGVNMKTAGKNEAAVESRLSYSLHKTHEWPWIIWLELFLKPLKCDKVPENLNDLNACIQLFLTLAKLEPDIWGKSGKCVHIFCGIQNLTQWQKYVLSHNKQSGTGLQTIPNHMSTQLLCKENEHYLINEMEISTSILL